MLYFVIYDNIKKINNKDINLENVIFIKKKYKDPIKILLLICKKLKPDDIICFINQYNTIVLDTEENIIKKFNETIKTYNMNKTNHILFSKLKKPLNIYEKYNQDKMFPRFDNYHIDTRLFIGSVNAISNFWIEYDKNLNQKNSYHSFVHNMALDPILNTNKKNSNNFKLIVKETKKVKIDILNKFFYNYSDRDSIIFNNKIIINGETPLIVSGYDFLTSSYLSFNNKPILKFTNNNLKISNNFYNYKSNKLEIITLIVLLTLLNMSKYKLLVFIGSLALLGEILHYQILIKHYKIKDLRKFIYTIIDFIHMCLLGGMFYLLFNYDCNTKQILFLNTVYLMVIVTFFIYKRCALTIVENKILGIDTNYATMSLKKRVTYFLNLNSKYEFYKGTKKTNHEYWMKSNMYTVCFIILSNLFCLIKLSIQ